MPDIGESINPPFPLQNQKHTEVAASIVDIQDAAGTSIMGGGTEYDPKQNAVSNGQKTIIKYQVQNQPAAVSLFIEPDPGNSPALNYYPILAKVFETAFVDPGQYSMEWDGRCPHDGNRYIIQGAYKVHLLATCTVCGIDVRDEKSIKVKKPCACVYGCLYPEKYAARDFTGDASYIRSKLSSLSDGTGFEPKGTGKNNGAEALVETHEEAAFFYWRGHGGFGILSMSDGTTQSGLFSEDVLLDSYKSYSHSPGVIGGLPDHALDDIFIAVAQGCETASSHSIRAAIRQLVGLFPVSGATSIPDAFRSKGVDVVLGFKPTIPHSASKVWRKDFIDKLVQGSSIQTSADYATANVADPDDQQALTAVIFGDGNASILPARYGRKKD